MARNNGAGEDEPLLGDNGTVITVVNQGSDDPTRRFLQEHVILDGKLPAPSSGFNAATVLGYTFGAYQATIFLGSNWFESQDKKFGMKLVHAIAALGYNFILGGYYSQKAFAGLPNEYRVIIQDFFKHKGYSIAHGIDFMVRLVLSYFASDTFAALYKKLPWGNELVRQSYFVGFGPLNLAGINYLLLKDIYPILKGVLRDAWIALAANAEFRQHYTLTLFKEHMVSTTLEVLRQASRLVKSGKIKTSKQDPFEAILETLNSKNFNMPSTLWAHSSTALATVFSIILIFSNTGLVRDTIPEKGDIYGDLAASTAAAAFLGLALRSSIDLANGFVNFSLDLWMGVKPVATMSNWKTLLSLGMPCVTIFAMAGLTAQTSLDTNRIFLHEVLKSVYQFFAIMAVGGCVIFNGAPMAILFCQKVLAALKRYFEPPVDTKRNIDRLITAISEASTLEDKFAIILKFDALCAVEPYTNLYSANISSLELVKQKMAAIFGPRCNPSQVMGYLGDHRHMEAARYVQATSGIGLPHPMRKELLIRYGMNAILPAAAFYIMAYFSDDMDLFESDTLNQLTGDGVLFLSFTISLLIQMIVRWCTDAASSPRSFKEFSAAITRTFGPAVCGVGVGYLGGLFTGPAVGDYAIAKDCGHMAGISAAIVAANS